ncbi:MAG TPA: ABC transporter substrate-binding protein [Thermoanaerobaculia bacterium]|nr:ABC transporter substrate-binding protein [Thermoanaerobaculia bacterium]HQR66416.1 ABC transporter substrate-binding protein [Thermoanaerobaculia bacterium]
MPRTRPLAAFLLGTGLALAAAAGPLVAAAEAPVRLKVLYVRFLSFAPIAIAQAEGYFRSEGLDVEMVTLPESAGATPELIKGELDVVAGMVKIGDFNAIARGASLRLVADKGHFEPGPCAAAAFVARREFVAAGSPDRPERLRGARIASRSLSFIEYLLDLQLGRMGLSLADVKLVRIPEIMIGEAIAGDSLDVGELTEPDLTRALASGRAVLWKPVQEISSGAQLGAVYFGPTLLEKNREAGRRFLAAYLRGVRQYNLGKTPRNLEILSKETGLEPELLRKACWQPIRGDGKINVESVLDFQRWAVRRGALDAVVPAEKFWDPSFAEAAERALRPPKP